MTTVATTQTNTRRLMPLEALLAGIAPLPDERWRSVQVRGVYDDSRQVRPGGLFVAVPGTQVDGSSFIPDALARGAVAIVGARVEPDDHAACIVVPDARAALARLAMRWYGLDGPDGVGLQLLAVTGTNGKTTTAYLTRSVLETAGLRCGMIGTVACELGTRSLPGHLTTPGVLALAGMLREAVDAGLAALVMEVSSHALDQQRTSGLSFAAAAFTNLTQDHLDYHGTLEAYGQAKARLFEQLATDGAAVINIDDAFGSTLAKRQAGRVISYALDRAADLTARAVRTTCTGTSYRLRCDGAEVAVRSALIGRHNVYNALAAAGLARALEIPPHPIAAGLSAVRCVPGRLERIAGIADFDVLVDYAHTPDALERVCAALHALAKRRLIVVFGCGGDRDRGKRPLMGQAAARHAHAVIITSDNPRSEDPRAIIDDILEGLDAKTRSRVLVEPDRRAAIAAALAAARPGDLVLIAGKGHEDYQLVGTQRNAFDDRQVVREVARELGKLREEEGPAT